ncbi:MAG: selenide, water dikinase SelD, partial [Pseudomonadota bacterium]
ATMAAAGAQIVGGHTSLGDELTIGFTITGLTKSPITLAGAQPGDALILTKPLGSGTIMAAEMRSQARGEDVIACLAYMTQSQAGASDILQKAKAMTDVTGFGLAGHLRGICDASGVGAQITLGAIPVMQGALKLSETGIRSTIFDDNRQGAGPISGPGFDLLFDPQTAGGLLAAVSAKDADRILAALRDAGYRSAIIGAITDTGLLETTP